MSLVLLLLALQGAETPTYPPPLKVKPVTVTDPSPTANPTVVYKPAPKTTDVPAANPKITYVPAAKPATPAESPAAETPPAGPLGGLSAAARARLAEEKQADAERRAELRREMGFAQDAIARALTADPLDMGALKVALEHRDSVMAQSRSKVTLAVLDLLGDVPPEERVTVAKALIESDSSPQRPAAEQKPKPSPVGR